MDLEPINSKFFGFSEITYSNFSDLIIPFSNFVKKLKPSDIYSGIENIPFKERDPEFKNLLISEFLEPI